MLEVHRPHAAAHTWIDFLIHIATIVVGLLIAIGLEQTVEYFHHRHQIAEGREALRLERENNKGLMAWQGRFWRWETEELQNNLTVLQYLQQHPGTPQEKLPGVLRWDYEDVFPIRSAWDAASRTGITALMPQDEVAKDAQLYSYLEDESRGVNETFSAIVDAEKYNLLDSDPSHMTAAQLAESIALTQTALTKHITLGVTLENLHAEFPDFPKTVSFDDIHKVRHFPGEQTKNLLARADALTLARLMAAGWLPFTDGPRDPRGPPSEPSK